MKKDRFTATILEGHKEAAFEVPFDPAEHWGIPPRPLWAGRRGHHVRGTLDGTSFESVVVPRSRKFFVRVDDALRKAAGVAIGDSVKVSLEPRDPAPAKAGPAASAPGPEARAALERVRRISLALPEAHEKVAWGAPTFRVRDRLFVMFVDNHHRDGRLAIWCNAPPGVQGRLVEADPKHFFVPPYVGPGGWIGVRLDTGLEWTVVAGIVREAYKVVAPKRLITALEQARTRV